MQSTNYSTFLYTNRAPSTPTIDLEFGPYRLLIRVPSFVAPHSTERTGYDDISATATSIKGRLYVVMRRPFVKQFALCYRSVVLAVCDVGVLWPNGWMDQDET